MTKLVKFQEFEKNWKQCILVKNMSVVNFIRLLKKKSALLAKNAKPQYANEIETQFFKEWLIQ